MAQLSVRNIRKALEVGPGAQTASQSLGGSPVDIFSHARECAAVIVVLANPRQFHGA